MSYLGKETQITEAGQAIVLNTEAIYQLGNALKNGLGPNGAVKMLITPAGEIRIVKDGLELLRNIQLAQPGAVLLSKLLTQQGNEYGDGVTSTIVIISALLKQLLEYVHEGIHPQVLIAGILKQEKKLLDELQKHKIQFDQEKSYLKALAHTTLRSKFSQKKAAEYSQVLLSAVEKVTETNPATNKTETDLKMLEIIKMMNIDSNQTLRLVDGLVLDHGGRHPMMPKKLENVFILCTNISFEYEKPELNAQFYYKRTEDKLKLEEGERRLILNKIQKIIECMQKVAQAHQSQSPQFMLITQKGIDPHALEVFARYNILALRRAKKRNMERLQKLAGCTPISSISELTPDYFGFAGQVKEISVGEEKYTFIEKTPFHKTCTILIQGISPYHMEYTESAVKAALKSISCGLADGCVLPGGASVYPQLAKSIEKGTSIEEEASAVAWKAALLAVPKTLARNLGHNSVETLSKIGASAIENPTMEILSGEIVDAVSSSIIDNYSVIENAIQAASLVVTKILMIDEIIKSGKDVK
ncbi:T-complex protein 1 subunit zeta [Nematocida sp. AWRm80]|nr:T-complex protein 1 subunit zeta [Nematocida sp. AWRm80]